MKEPYWKRKIEDGIARLRKDLSQIEDWFKDRWKNIKHKRKDELRRKYSIKTKGFETVIEELKQRITAKAGKWKRSRLDWLSIDQINCFTAISKHYMKDLVVNAGKLVIQQRHTMLGNFEVSYRINLFRIRKILNG